MSVVVASVFGAFIALAFRLNHLHRGDHSSRLASQERRQDLRVELRAPRGQILDRNGRILALDKVAGHVSVDPRFIWQNEDKPSTAKADELAGLLGVSPATVANVLKRRDTQWQPLRKFVPDDAAEAVRQRLKEGGLRGVILESTSVRRYPLGPVTAHIVGYSSSLGHACAGVEMVLDDYLSPVNGYREAIKDAKGNEMATRLSSMVSARPGATVQLTIDEYLQYVVDQKMEAAMKENRATAAWAILMKVKTGEIVAMVSKPGFDPNETYDFTSPARINHAIMTCYEPGSVMKVVTYAAALNEGLVRTTDMIDCEFGVWSFAGKILRDAHAYGMLSFADAFMKSSNIATAKISVDKLGAARLEDYMKRFGMGRKTGIELPYEESGIFHPRSKWSQLSLSRLPIGQGIAVTPLQMINAVNTIANGGVRMRPTLLKRVTDASGNLLHDFAPETMGRAVSPKVATTMQWMMGRVCSKDGTARRAIMEGYPVGGKTGTAQKPVPGGYSSTDYIASFAGFVPADDPEFSLLVAFDSPRPLHQGGVVAAPVFKQIAEEAVRYLRIPARDPELIARFLTPHD